MHVRRESCTLNTTFTKISAETRSSSKIHELIPAAQPAVEVLETSLRAEIQQLMEDNQKVDWIDFTALRSRFKIGKPSARDL